MQGQKIGERYEILRTLGEGSQGQTFLVKDLERRGRLTALKVYRRGSPEQERAFRRECELLHSLRHPNIARLEDWGEAEASLYYATEYVEGQDLVREAAGRDWNAVFQLMVQACWALGELHERGILHRDLKPEHLLVGRVHGAESGVPDRLRLKLIDFGLALSPGTSTPAAAGTLPYMAPEVLAGRACDHRADLYSLGVVFYQLALGKHPELPQGAFADYLAALSQGNPDLETLRQGGVPRGVIQCIAHLVLADPARRLGSAAEVIRCLNQFEGEHFPLAAPTTPLPAAPRPATAAPAAPKAHSPEEVLKNLLTLSRGGKKGEALAFAQPYLPQVWGWKDSALAADFLATLIYLLAELGRLPEAEHWLKKMQEHPALRAKPHLEYFLTGAYLAFRKGRRREAKALLERTPEALLQQAPAAKRARFENYLGIACQGERDFVQAALHFERAADHAHEAKRRDQEASFAANAAALYFEQNRWAKAYQLYQSALSLARELNNRALEASILNNLGNLYLYFGRWHEAEGALIRSLDLARQEGLKPLIAYNLYLMTVAEEGRGNPEKVADFLRQALAFGEDLGEAEAILQARLARAHFEFSQRRYEPAEVALAELEQAAEAAGEAKFLLQAEWLRARLALAQGRGREPWLAASLEKVREDAAGRAAANALWQVHADIAELELAQKRFAEAEASFHRAQEILNELVLEVPEAYRESFFRDRKKERILRGLETVAAAKRADLETTDAAIALPPEPAAGAAAELPFARWTELNRRLLQQHHSQALLEEILACALQLTDAERGFVILSENDELEIRAARNLDAQALASEEMQFSRSVAKEVLRQGSSQVILDAQGDQRFSLAASVKSLQLRSLLCVPLRAGTRAKGLLYLDNRLRQGVFTAEHLPLLEALADQASLALEHARLHEENARAIQELTQSKALIEKLNAALERDLQETSANLEAAQEGLRRQNEELALKYKYEKIIGESPKLKAVLKSLDKVVDSNINVFIFGESGTGKELIAQAIHFNGPRADKPFITENCAALPETLLESELFGHVRGAFTGADRNKVGLFEAAHGGTVFLDEVGEMSAALQAKLLRVLQEGTVRRLGETQYRRVDVRVISASNKDLWQLVQEKKFRQDLYFRLNVMRLQLPPLRERREDIPLLLDHFFKLQAEETGTRPLHPNPEALKILMNYDWPGNIRELQNEVRRLGALASGREVTPEQLSPHLQAAPGAGLHDLYARGLDPQIEDLEKKAILQTLGMVRGNKVKAAQLLKISRRTLYLKMQAFGIERRFGKQAPQAPAEK
ncbi:MAG: sigma 54-interacting transcriptional regulator [bacterium]